MKKVLRRLLIGTGAIALFSAAPVLAELPVRTQIKAAADALVKAVQRPDVALTLSAEKQIVETKANGETEISWQSLAGQVQVLPGDVLRYTVDGANQGSAAAENLVVTQPIPAQTTYVLDSASSGPALTTYSIDGGETFVETPLVEVTLPDGSVELQPAPAERYSHIRWRFNDTLPAATEVRVSYQVEVN